MFLIDLYKSLSRHFRENSARTPSCTHIVAGILAGNPSRTVSKGFSGIFLKNGQ